MDELVAEFMLSVLSSSANGEGIEGEERPLQAQFLIELNHLTIWLEHCNDHPLAPRYLRDVLNGRPKLNVRLFGDFTFDNPSGSDTDERKRNLEYLRQESCGRLEVIKPIGFVEDWYM